jgi:hypothetical protein
MDALAFLALAARIRALEVELAAARRETDCAWKAAFAAGRELGWQTRMADPFGDLPTQAHQRRN